MSSPPEDELARTATDAVGAASATPEAVGAASATPACPADGSGARLGRYRLERELGAGGMGVVHAAFDLDLQRRIALKVLRMPAPSTEAKDRLLREARAMARLSHANVVTVYEVGTTNGRDFVAMELIHGESLAEWLRAARRAPAVIVDAFIAAGRGLAAAHAAGIVHRDFKPHNVLRSREGRIVVTDFGLAREVQGAVSIALDATLPAGMDAGPHGSLAGLTVTGALLGTPAYMAPEQWSGGAVTPATDQFAYCVALWEALTGERPYRGPTLDDLRRQVAKGPAVLDASRVPRRIRRILLRGLDPDPARRWPTMDGLLDQLVRAKRRPGLALGIAGAAAAAAAVVVIAVQTASAPAAVMCPPPARAVAAMWSPAIAADMRARTSEAHAAVLDAAYRGWQATRVQACSAPPQVQQAQLQCLDGVLARFDAVRQGYARVPGTRAEDIQAQLIDSEICRKPTAAEVPRLAIAANPDVLAAYELYGRSETAHKPSDDELAALAGNATSDPCARVIAMLALDTFSTDVPRLRAQMLALDMSSTDVPRLRAQMNETVNIADQCGDERLRADLLIELVQYQREQPMIGPKGEAAIKQAQLAIKRVAQPDLEARLAVRTIDAARQRAQWTEAFRLADAAIAGYLARGLTMRAAAAVTGRGWLRLNRGEPGDLAAIAADVKRWRPIVEANRDAELLASLDDVNARVSFKHGDVASAHADLLRLWQATASRRPRAGPSRKVDGIVVDTQGRPVAGARVVSAALLGADAVGLGLPIRDLDDTLRIATTDIAGRFHLEDATPVGVVAAELADRRSRPAMIEDHVRLVLEPTRRASGQVDLRDIPTDRAVVFCAPADATSDRYAVVAPIAPDGSFSCDGAGVGALYVGVMILTGWASENVELQTLPASTKPVTGLQLAVATSKRELDVIVRHSVDAPLDGVAVFLLSGKHVTERLKTVADLLRLQAVGQQTQFAVPVVGENVPKAVIGKIRTGDLIAHFAQVRPGDLTVCAFTIGGDLAKSSAWLRVRDHAEQLALKCAAVAPDADLVIVAVPPQQRLD
jgi:predicted Ser/Thr protein kinase